MTDLQIPTQPLAGQLRFIHYAFMPNRLQYCGGDDNRTLLEYGTAQVVDGGLTPPAAPLHRCPALPAADRPRQQHPRPVR